MKKISCFYHRSDMDGHSSAAVVMHYAKKNNIDIECYGWDYGDELDFLQGDKESTAVIVDITPPEEYFEKMTNHYESVVWIDHHKSAIEEISKKKFFQKLEGIQEIGSAACELTWKYFFRNKQKPLAISLLGTYDVHNVVEYWDDVVMPFQYGCRLHQGEFVEDTKIDWDGLFGENSYPEVVSEIIVNGDICLEFEKASYQRTAAGACYECEFEGLDAIAINHSTPGSMIFDGFFDKDKHDIMILWRFKEDCWSVSLYSDDDSDIDCSVIAKKHGGGGHKGASGFTLPLSENPLKLFAPLKK